MMDGSKLSSPFLFFLPPSSSLPFLTQTTTSTTTTTTTTTTHKARFHNVFTYLPYLVLELPQFVRLGANNALTTTTTTTTTLFSSWVGGVCWWRMKEQRSGKKSEMIRNMRDVKRVGDGYLR